MASYLCAKTLLSAYAYVPKIVREIDDIIAEHAIRSSGFDYSSFSQLSTFSQISKMVKLTDLKNRAIFIRNHVEEVIAKLPFNMQKLLSDIFFENQNVTKVVMLGEFSPRTYYRRILQALELFELKVNESGYTIKDFERDYINDDWIYRIRERFIKKKAA